MTEQVPFVRVQTPMELAIEDVRKAQINSDIANEQVKDLSVSLGDARVRADEARTELFDARDRLYREAIRPLTPTPSNPPISEDSGPEEAAWSDGAPDADKDLIQSDDAATESDMNDMGEEESAQERQLKDQLEN